ncbi:hypothetical protein DVK02_15945, partial [Halobellus sp. Atlit-31R]
MISIWHNYCFQGMTIATSPQIMINPKLLAVAALFTSLIAAPVGAAPILVGAASLNTIDDLTVIKDGSTTYEFLDLTSTQNMTSSSAVTAFSLYGFELADSDDLTRLFASFGFG